MEEPGQPLIVVSNTSPLTNLAAIGQFHLLQDLFDHLSIAKAVEAELFFRGKAWPGAIEVREACWIEILSVDDYTTVEALRLDLDPGEAETIVLALQHQADLVLLDELAGRRAAKYFGLKVMGVVGLLVRAKQFDLVDEVGPLLNALRQQAGFHMSNRLMQYALALSRER